MSPIQPVTPAIVGPLDCIEFRDLNFVHRPVMAHSSRGVPFTRWIPVGMPRLPPRSLDCVCYLYRGEEEASAGKDFGGTAFLVGVPSRFTGRVFIDAVTNWHNACKRGASVLRVNTRDGGTDIFPFGPEDWEFDPRFDIAAIHVPLNREIHRYSIIPIDGFVSKSNIERAKLGPGDDVFMIGRFIDHDGGPINRPAVRFGNISVMPSPIEQPNGKMADCYCVDMHSRSGYSGSPVFVYRTPGYDLEEMSEDDPAKMAVLLSGTIYLALLGIHFAQFPEKWELVCQPPIVDEENAGVPLIREGGYVKGLSGMTCVLPAWHIMDVLNLPRLKALRERSDAVEAERREREGSPPEPEGRANQAAS